MGAEFPVSTLAVRDVFKGTFRRLWLTKHLTQVVNLTVIVYLRLGVSVKDYIPKSLVNDKKTCYVLFGDQRVVLRCCKVASKLVNVSKRIILSKSVGCKLFERVSRRRLAIHNSPVDDCVSMTFDSIDF